MFEKNSTGYIMSGNTPVARFDGRQITPVLPDRVPLCFRYGGDLEDWLEHRAIDRHRTHSRILKRILRLGDSSDLNTALNVHGATITDNYWVKKSDEDISWDQVKFSRDYFANIALRCHVDDFVRNFSETELKTPTPELTNIGSFEKCWRLIDEVWTMLKTGTPEERFSEIFICKLCTSMGLPTAEYYELDGYTATPDFTAGQMNFEPMRNLVYDDESYNRSYETLKAFGKGLENQYLDIIFMDVLILNADRHTENYGILRDWETGEILSMAPNFDNNIALISQGYSANGFTSPNLLIREFHDLLENQNIQYQYPMLPTQQELRNLIADAAVGMDINQDYVLQMVQSNYRYLTESENTKRI